MPGDEMTTIGLIIHSD